MKALAEVLLQIDGANSDLLAFPHPGHEHGKERGVRAQARAFLIEGAADGEIARGSGPAG
jgi:hypothetical protein